MLTQRGATPVFQLLIVPNMSAQLKHYPIDNSITMENQEQEQFVPQTEGQLTDGVKVTEIFPFLPDHLLRPLPPEVLTNPQEAQSVVLEELQRRRVQPPVPHDDSLPLRLGYIATVARTRAPEGQEFPYNAFYQDGRMHFRADPPATEVCAEAAAEQAPNAEPTSVQQKGKNVNQKKRQAPLRVGKRLTAKVERLTAYGIVVRQGKFRAHLDFQYMAVSDEGTAIRFQPGDKVECRVLSLELKGGLPRVTMLGQMLPPVKRPATAIQAEVVSLLAGHAVFGQLSTGRPSQEAMELHEGFAAGMAEAVAQSVELPTEAPAETDPVD